jgi:hypothetical protein
MRSCCYSGQIAFDGNPRFCRITYPGGLLLSTQSCSAACGDDDIWNLAVTGVDSRVPEGLFTEAHMLHRLHLGSIILLDDFTHDTIRLPRLAIKRVAESSCHPSAENPQQLRLVTYRR